MTFSIPYIVTAANPFLPVGPFLPVNPFLLINPLLLVNPFLLVNLLSLPVIISTIFRILTPERPALLSIPYKTSLLPLSILLY